MAKCKNKSFTRERLCSGDLNKFGELSERIQKPAELEDTDGRIVFEKVKDLWFGIETLSGMNSGSARFKRINISPDATHLFFINYDPELPLVDKGNYFIIFEERYFRVITVTNKDEDNLYLFFQVTERGPIDKAAAEA